MREGARRYAATGDDYLANADEIAGRRDFRKAGEIYWGAINQYVKALAANETPPIDIERNQDFIDYWRMKASRDRERFRPLYAEWVQLRLLHKNFFDEEIPPDTFFDWAQRAHRYIESLAEILTES